MQGKKGRRVKEKKSKNQKLKCKIEEDLRAYNLIDPSTNFRLRLIYGGQAGQALSLAMRKRNPMPPKMLFVAGKLATPLISPKGENLYCRLYKLPKIIDRGGWFLYNAFVFV